MPTEYYRQPYPTADHHAPRACLDRRPVAADRHCLGRLHPAGNRVQRRQPAVAVDRAVWFQLRYLGGVPIRASGRGRDPVAGGRLAQRPRPNCQPNHQFCSLGVLAKGGKSVGRLAATPGHAPHTNSPEGAPPWTTRTPSSGTMCNPTAYRSSAGSRNLISDDG